MLDSAAVLVAIFVVVSATAYVLYAFPKTTGTETGRGRAWSTMPPSGPRSARWMAANWRGAKSALPPHIYRSSAAPTGLRPLDLADWIELEPDRFEAQMKLKRGLIEGSDTARRFYASLAGEGRRGDVLDAEREVLATLVDHLERYCASQYTVSRAGAGEATAVVETATGREFRVEDYAACPLKLCGLLVQEDFILLSPGAEGGAPPRFVAGCATFSFMEIGIRGEKGRMRLGESVPFIHTAVPGFNDAGGIGPKVAKFFERLVPGSPQYRSNWILVAEEGLNPMRYDLSGDRAEGGAVYLDVNDVAPEELHLRVELQSVRRLARSRHILFTLHCYSDPLPSLAALTEGASVLRLALLELDRPRMAYRGMSGFSVKRCAKYLEGLAGDCA